MSNRYDFTSPFSFGDGGEPWFRIGKIEFTTTVTVVSLAVINLFWWTLEGIPWPNLSKLAFSTSAILEGEVWRLFTWPFVNVVNIWSILAIVIFYLFGSQLERTLGRKHFLALTLSLILIPAILVTLVSALSPEFAINSARLTEENLILGIRPLELGIFIAFSSHMPFGKIFGIIPIWIASAGIVLLEIMNKIGLRFWPGVLLIIIVTLVSLLFMRAIGFTHESLNFLPKLPLDSLLNRKQGYKTKKKQTNLRVVSPVEEANIDSLLDQISEKGYDSLSKDQKKQLDKYSKKMRKDKD